MNTISTEARPFIAHAIEKDSRVMATSDSGSDSGECGGGGDSDSGCPSGYVPIEAHTNTPTTTVDSAK